MIEFSQLYFFLGASLAPVFAVVMLSLLVRRHAQLK